MSCLFCQSHQDAVSGVHARLCKDSELSNPIEHNCDIKQGCKLAPTVFGIYAAIILYVVLRTLVHIPVSWFLSDMTGVTYLISGT